MIARKLFNLSNILQRKANHDEEVISVLQRCLAIHPVFEGKESYSIVYIDEKLAEVYHNTAKNMPLGEARTAQLRLAESLSGGNNTQLMLTALVMLGRMVGTLLFMILLLLYNNYYFFLKKRCIKIEKDYRSLLSFS